MVEGRRRDVPSSVATLRRARADLVAQVKSSDGSPQTAHTALEQLAHFDTELHQREAREQRRRVDALAEINQAIRRLHALASPAELIEAAPRELCRACGMSRAMISRVQGSLWVPGVLHIDEDVDADGADAFRAYVEQAEIPLAHMLLEAELVRRRIPALVPDPQTDARTHKEIVDVSRSTSYVVAPIMPTRRVIGFLHADRFGGRPVDEVDRDNLWAFAEHFGLLFERAVLVDRLERQRTELRSAFADAAEQIDAIVSTDIALARTETPCDADFAAGPATPRSRLDALLTAREQEVLELMASGATNTMIAEQLVVSEGTVKSHVKRILRKLHVHNRAEAVARYLHVAHRVRERG